MAKYTLEIRDIVESLNVDLFDFDYEYYSDNYALQKRFENMFIQHYYFHEIGFETVERFKLNLQARLNINAPKYKQMWDSHLATKNIDFTVNKEYFETITRELETESESTSSSQNDSRTDDTRKSVASGDSKSSHIGDGVSKARLTDDYVTSVTGDTSSSQDDATSKSNTSSSSNSDNKGKQFEVMTTNGKGNIGTTSSAQLIKEWRDIMLNLDRQLIEDCSDLFMQIY